MNTAEIMSSSTALSTLISGLITLPQPSPVDKGLRVTGLKIDSSLLQAGDLFLACVGHNHDARDYIEQAIEVGVAVVLAEAGGHWQGVQMIKNVPVIAVDNLHSKLSEIAGRYYGCPNNNLTLVGITGTNGKTSCSFFLAQAFALLGKKPGVVGTLGYGAIDDLTETDLTTPDAVTTQRALAEMRDTAIDVVAMEVSSVGIHQKRVKALRFETAVFTNLSRDHLDYHESMDSYAETKAKLFATKGLQNAVVNLDDHYATQMLNSIPKDAEIYTYSLTNKIAAIYATDLALDRKGFKATVHTPFGSGKISGNLIGYFNISNLLAVVSVLLANQAKSSDFDLQKILATVSQLEPVSGRMEIVGDTAELTAIVDYAHSPDGLKSALSAVRDHFDGRIWCVFGCGGNRDKGKRPLMGEIAETYADQLIIADDNPRTEKGDEIVKHIQSGISNNSKVKVLRDRAQAIDYAIEHAAEGDVVVIAGKGHETYQDVGGSKLMFSDVNQVRLALKQRAQM